MVCTRKEASEANLVEYNRRGNIISSIDTILGVAAIGLGITGVGLLPTIIAAPAIIGIESVAIVVGITNDRCRTGYIWN